jgi:hypothetical protein
MTGIASGLVRTNRTAWRRRFSAKCGPSTAPLGAELHVVNTRRRPFEGARDRTTEGRRAALVAFSISLVFVALGMAYDRHSR